MHLDTVVIGFVALFFLGTGVVGLFAPAFVAGVRAAGAWIYRAVGGPTG